MKIRFATVADVPALTALGRRAHAQTRYAAYDYDEIRVADNLAGIIEIGQNGKGTHCLLLAENDRGDIAGVLIGLIERQLFSDLPVANVLVYYVLPDKRMTGAGFRLITAFRKWAENRSAFEICVCVTSAAHVQRTDRFLTRIGFQRMGCNYSLHSRSERPAGIKAPYDDD